MGRNVGIIGISVYLPWLYVSQRDLELHDAKENESVSPGKYTLGLGQETMACCSVREDVNSMALTVVSRLLKDYKISPERIGRLDVGTESQVDKSKSVRTHLMDLFSDLDSDLAMEGADNINACYGATAALINACNWVESPSWDGRYAVVVGADIAVYDKGPARPTGGAGAVALLISADAPIVVDVWRPTFSKNVYDFYKPDPGSEYPQVDGRLSLECYFESLLKVLKFFAKIEDRLGSSSTASEVNNASWIFHTPFVKMVQKAYARVRAFQSKEAELDAESILAWNRDDEKRWVAKSKADYNRCVKSSTLLASQSGNSYCASLWISLASLLHHGLGRAPASDSDAAFRVFAFSYGSGYIATGLVLRIDGGLRGVSAIREALGSSLAKWTDVRKSVSPEAFEEMLAARQAVPWNRLERQAAETADSLIQPGVYFLSEIDSVGRRRYLVKR